MDEFEIIRRYFTPKKTHKRVVVGVGDDAAVLRPKPGRDLVTAVDTLVAGVHFHAVWRPKMSDSVRSLSVHQTLQQWAQSHAG